MGKKRINNKDKNKKTIITLGIIIAFLVVVCLVSILYNFLGGYYYTRIVEYDKILGEEQTIIIESEGTNSTACNLSGTTLLGENIYQPIFIEAGSLINPLYIRAKSILVGYSMNVEMNGCTNWTLASDGYIYFNQKINSMDKIGLCTFIKFNENIHFETNINYILIFVVECSDVTFDINN